MGGTYVPPGRARVKRHTPNGTAVNTDAGRCVSAVRTRGGGFRGRAGGAAAPPNKIREEQNYLFAISLVNDSDQTCKRF